MIAVSTSTLRNTFFGRRVAGHVTHVSACPVACRFLCLYGVLLVRDKGTVDKNFKDDNGRESGEKEMNNKVKKRGSKLSSGSNDVPKTFSPEERQIYLAHKKAEEADEDLYKDPATGYDVFTEKTLRNRDECCGNACRHVSSHTNMSLEDFERIRVKAIKSLM